MADGFGDALIQFLNDALHWEPISFLAERMYWCFMFVVVCPLAGVGQLFLVLYDLVLFLTGKKNATIPEVNDTSKELAVVITGCDSGFGKELALSLLSSDTSNVVVFCGCLQEESMAQYNNDTSLSRAIPLKMDITNDKEIKEACEAVSEWLSETNNNNGKQRCLHALVNNAGIGSKGLIDWFEMSDIQMVMDVNFLGMVRVVKAFLPILKQQAAEGTHGNARIVNMVSVAGLFSGTILSVLYESSKHAAEAFTTNLRREMQMFGIKVTALNPGVFVTPMYKIMEAEGKGLLCRTWNKLSEEKKQEYGQDFFNELYEAPVPPAWKSEIVINEMKQCILLQNPPDKVIPGMDARYALALLGKLPVWLSNTILNQAMGPHTIPAMMTTAKNKNQERRIDPPTTKTTKNE